MIVDMFLVYSILRRLVKPFKKWDAYKYGIIDKNGKILRHRKELKTRKEKKAFQLIDVMILNLKKLLNKLPAGQTKLGSYAAALWLIGEGKIEKGQTTLTEADERSLENFIEEVVANNAGDGKIAGIGVGPQGEPPGPSAFIRRKKKKKKEEEEDDEE